MPARIAQITRPVGSAVHRPRNDRRAHVDREGRAIGVDLSGTRQSPYPVLQEACLEAVKGQVLGGFPAETGDARSTGRRGRLADHRTTGRYTAEAAVTDRYGPEPAGGSLAPGRHVRVRRRAFRGGHRLFPGAFVRRHQNWCRAGFRQQWLRGGRRRRGNPFENGGRCRRPGGKNGQNEGENHESRSRDPGGARKQRRCLTGPREHPSLPLHPPWPQDLRLSRTGSGLPRPETGRRARAGSTRMCVHVTSVCVSIQRTAAARSARRTGSCRWGTASVNPPTRYLRQRCGVQPLTAGARDPRTRPRHPLRQSGRKRPGPDSRHRPAPRPHQGRT